MAESLKVVEKEKSRKKEVLKVPENPEYRRAPHKKTNTLFSKIRNIENDKKDTNEA